MIIDFHVHCFVDELAEKAISILSGRSGVRPRLNGTVGNIRESMLKYKIDCSVVVPIVTKPGQTQKINDWSCEIQDESIVAFGSIHPDYPQWKDELKRIEELGLKGIKLHPDYQQFYVDEDRILPIYEEAFELGLIVLLHSGVDIGLPSPYHCTPERLYNVIRTLPGGKVVAAHMGGYDCWDDVEEYLVGEDIYLDTSYSLGRISDEQAKRIIDGHGYDKILFATDSPWTDQGEEIKKIKRLGLSEEKVSAVLGENAGKLLSI